MVLKHKIISLLFFILVLRVVFPTYSWSLPTDITLFSDSAQIIEVTKVKIVADEKGHYKATFIIPGNAFIDTLMVALSGNTKARIDEITWQQVAHHDERKIAELRNQLEKLKENRLLLQASLRAVETQIQFWQQQTKTKVKTLTDAHNLSASMGKNMKKFSYEKATLEVDLEKISKRIHEVQEEIDRITGGKEKDWEVTLFLSGSPGKEETLTYSYTIPGCGWHPLYRLEAKPQLGHVVFSWEAEIWQSTSKDWQKVNINLATLKPTSAIAPGELPPWIIQPRPVKEYGREKRVKMLRAEKEDEVVEERGTPEDSLAVPQQVRRSTYAIWHLGKKNLPAGTKERVKIQDEVWSAEFVHLVRPSLGNQAYVKASIQFSDLKEIPPGTALFLIDGAILGKRNFSVAGKHSFIFFGTDPMVSASRQLLSKQSGEKTFLKDKQTYTWSWRIDILNASHRSVTVVVEEPNPQVRDERITLIQEHTPLYTEKTSDTLTWKIPMSAGDKKTIFSTIRLEAPKDMILDLGGSF